MNKMAYFYYFHLLEITINFKVWSQWVQFLKQIIEHLAFRYIHNAVESSGFELWTFSFESVEDISDH